MTASADPDVGWRQWSMAAADQRVDAALRRIYAELDAAVQARGPTCWISGRCCHFDSYGHRLYVSGLEIAWVLQQHRPALGPRSTPPAAAEDAAGSGSCPFQIDKLCSIHTIRPLGCRVFFCEKGTEVWQNQLYERFQRRIRDLHDVFDLPYRYMEWRVGLSEATTALPMGP